MPGTGDGDHSVAGDLSAKFAGGVGVADGVGLGGVGGDDQRRRYDASVGIEQRIEIAVEHGVEHRWVDGEERTGHRHQPVGFEQSPPSSAGRRGHGSEEPGDTPDRSCPTPAAAGSRLTHDAERRRAVRGPRPRVRRLRGRAVTIGGSSRTAARKSSGRCCMAIIAVMPPREWPMTTHGSPASCSHTAIASLR
jgi:hypothetical protein